MQGSLGFVTFTVACESFGDDFQYVALHFDIDENYSFFPNLVIMQQALWVTVLYHVLSNAELRRGEVLIFVPANLILLFKSSLKCQYIHCTVYLELILITYIIKKLLVLYL